MKTYPWLIFLLALALTSCSSDYTPVDAGEEILPDGEDGGQDGGEDGGESGCIDAYPGQVLITEIMVDPAAAAGQPGRFIELYNAGFETLYMQGWLLHDGVAEVEMALGEGTDFPPQTHLVIGFEADPLKNGGLEPELVIEGIDLDRRLLFIQVEDVEVDRVDFSGAGWTVPDGASLSLDPGKYDLMQNDLPENWCAATKAYGDGDLGTPGAQNTACVPAECGNNQTENPEHCDDGKNGDDLDGCRDDCTFTCEDPQTDCSDTAGDCRAPVCEPNNLGQVCGEANDDQDTPDDGDQCTYGVCTEGVGSQANHQDGHPCENSGGLPGDYCKEGTCIEPVCGDDIKGPLEQCDDGQNGDPCDGCLDDCTLHTSVCGDTYTCGTEGCDDGQNGDPCDGCLDDCTRHTNICGDRYVCGTEECDDGNTVGGDGCSADCKNEVEPECGDSIPQSPEECDDGKNGDPCDGCLDDCTLHTNVCGDTYTCGTEGCDDGKNGDPCDGCLDDCTLHTNVCGDTYTCGTEGCDDGQNGDPCDGCLDDCTLHTNTCGDTYTCGTEHCDDGNNGDDLDGCRDDCTFTCEDPQIDCIDTAGDCHAPACEPNGLGEVCAEVIDDQDPPNDGNQCTYGVCNQGIGSQQNRADGYPCYHAGGLPGDYCKAGVCIEPVCGDGIKGPLEQCDLGSDNSDTASGACPDVCRTNCLCPYCGDAVPDYVLGEDCDDGNFSPCDGCLPTCVSHTNTCGDGFTCAPEECDDANNQTGDGCTPECAVEGGTCPPDMVLIPADPANGVPDPFCMDIYEASRADATATWMGADVNKAVSQAGVIPWWVNPMTTRAFEQFQVACQSAGKRICGKQEFYTACSQAGQNIYVFGDVFNRETCNCVDTFCDDYCAEHSIDPCSTAANCGYTYYCFHDTPTGDFPGCTNDYGTFDICGNAWEIVPSDTDPWGRGYEVRGGAFNCAGAIARLQCTFNASWYELYAGFRCCRDY